MHITDNNIDDGTNKIAGNIISAVENNDIFEVKNIISENPESIFELNECGMNILQISLINLHDELSQFLANITDISARHKDVFNRDALDIVIMIGSEDLISVIEEKWCSERFAANEKGGKVTPLNQSPK